MWRGGGREIVVSGGVIKCQQEFLLLVVKQGVLLFSGLQQLKNYVKEKDERTSRIFLFTCLEL